LNHKIISHPFKLTITKNGHQLVAEIQPTIKTRAWQNEKPMKDQLSEMF
jgi:hypothetical protein